MLLSLIKSSAFGFFSLMPFQKAFIEGRERGKEGEGREGRKEVSKQALSLPGKVQPCKGWVGLPDG